MRGQRVYSSAYRLGWQDVRARGASRRLATLWCGGVLRLGEASRVELSSSFAVLGGSWRCGAVRRGAARCGTWPAQHSCWGQERERVASLSGSPAAQFSPNLKPKRCARAFAVLPSACGRARAQSCVALCACASGVGRAACVQQCRAAEIPMRVQQGVRVGSVREAMSSGR